MNDEIRENERKIVEYETHRTDVYRKVQSIVNRNFVEEFNHTFYCDIWKHGIPASNSMARLWKYHTKSTKNGGIIIIIV